MPENLSELLNWAYDVVARTIYHEFNNTRAELYDSEDGELLKRLMASRILTALMSGAWLISDAYVLAELDQEIDDEDKIELLTLASSSKAVP